MTGDHFSQIGAVLHSLPLFSHSPSLFLPLKVAPEIQLRGSGERCKLPGGIWGGTPVEIEFDAF